MVESELKSTKKQPIWLMVNRGEQNAGGFHYHLKPTRINGVPRLMSLKPI